MRTLSNFDAYNESVLMKRLKHVSYMLIFTYPCFFIVDFFFFRGLDLPIYKNLLYAIHITGPIISIIYLMIPRLQKDHYRKSIVHSYILIYLIIGAVSSIASQFLNGNVYVYIIILLGVAVIFPIRPRTLLIYILSVHLPFIAGLFLIEHHYYSFLSKMINTTGTAVIAFTIALSFYSYRKNDFFNRQKINRNEELFRRLFNLNPNPLFLLKPDLSKIVLVNKAGEKYCSLQNKKILARLNLVEELEKNDSIKNYCLELPEQRKWAMLNFEYVDYMDETCVLLSATDITELKEKEEMLYQHASIDALTGVLNRRSGMKLLDELIADGLQEFILCYLDINNLKFVNDQFGHSIGDELIKTCCDAFSQHLGKDDKLFRMGGDEFILILFNRNLESAKELLSAIHQELEELHSSHQKPYPISASYGFYHYKPGIRATVEEILEQADQDMYQNKFLYKQKETLQ